jgi:hypothetical protein
VRDHRPVGAGGGGRVALLVAALVVVIGAIAWLLWVGNRSDAPLPPVDVKVPAADVLPERTPQTPPSPLPTPNG